jgi:3-hydroxyacyl-CoA dehydrogenase
VLKVVEEFIRNIKKTGIKCKESPGFVVNRILLPVINECFYILEEEKAKTGKNIAELINTIDSAVLKEEILLMGPFDLVDLTGLDTIAHVAEVIHEGFQNSPRYIPAPLLLQYRDKGFFGRKSKRGLYWYGNISNDPDLNPPLDEKGEPVQREEEPEFNSLFFIAAIVNESFRVIEEGIVEDFRDIELSMEIGARWLKGPFQVAKETGLDRIREALNRRYAESGKNPRYEPSKLFTALTEDLKKYFHHV